MFRRVLRYFLILTAVVLLTMAFLLAMERPWTPRSAPAEAPPRSAAVTTAVAADGSATGHSAPRPVASQDRA
ncbi:hypothetical protein [Nonomuraea sp. NPDC050202]|uniref:hypothetical protein n=1 Tax=Nonomuraea sp. NPDC050202 TaxID=3155035 RepID=UPI0033FA25E3